LFHAAMDAAHIALEGAALASGIPTAVIPFSIIIPKTTVNLSATAPVNP
jgi:hypothetical protein